MVKITSVEKSSRAAKKGVREGDVLIAINNREINDVLDYRFFLTDTNIILFELVFIEILNLCFCA